ncbi:hypothetical protein [Marinagarivorans cellulosilyticus]|uniref:DUF1240 domain-containing protein n=1 Tax=Marinagarivorans cellulosilyticus TaxID=2721545 RepID=A0AAN2BKE1_9GAMM|nr:hypothetical protein [Marinagarivorans cellulosilyticus]BCD97892.1 hypothetical protein MARGE09_P2093 [Marinagarivorans cellulosilyticus]
MNKATASSEEQGTIYQLRIQSAIVLLLSVTLIILWVQVSDLLDNLDRLARENAYVSVSGWDLPTIVVMPCFFGIIYGLFLRLFNKATSARISKTMSICLFFAGSAVVARLVYGFMLSSFMANHGYSFCQSYTSPSIYARQVYVRDEGYCVPHTGVIRRDILAWLDQQYLPNKPLNPAAVREQVAVILAASDAER